MANAAPTGCYKCGRPGHWSRDCPSDPTTTTTTTEGNGKPLPNTTNTTSYRPNQKAKTKAPRRTRPKLTPEILLSDAGIGRILRYFPRAVRSRGRGHEVDDLQNLLGLYAEWHSRLLPYYSLDQFIHKVEQVGSTKHVKVCLRQLRDKIANGADPTKLHETQLQEQDSQGGLDMPSNAQDNALQNEDPSDFLDDMVQDVWDKATDETFQPSRVNNDSVNMFGGGDVNNNAGSSSQNQITEEQRARIEANRLKVLERAKSMHSLVNNVSVDVPGGEDATHQQTDTNAGSSSQNQITEEQIACMEANRLKVLEGANSQPSHANNVSVDISGGEDASHQRRNNNGGNLTEEQRARMEANRLKALERAAAKSRSLRT